MHWRSIFPVIFVLALILTLTIRPDYSRAESPAKNSSAQGKHMIEKIHKTEAEWRKLLTPAQYRILRQKGTEPAFSSPLRLSVRRL